MIIDTTKNIWITSDTHYSHKNLCRGITEWRLPDGSIPIDSTRDFPNLEKMNATMVYNINCVVMQDDVLIHLGDWSFGGFESIKEFWNRLVCKNIYLFLGNHDKHILINRNGIRDLFVNVDKEEENFLFEDNVFHLHHYPLNSWKDMKDGTIHLHGHTHLKDEKRFGKGKKMDVGICGHPEFRPYNLKHEIIRTMKKIDIVTDESYVSMINNLNDGE
jgi:calcineurin-like phosphoesterase family protein